VPQQGNVRMPVGRSFERSTFFERASRAECDAFERSVRDGYPDSGLRAHSLVDAGQQAPPPASRMPLLLMSAASSGGVVSQRSFHGADDLSDAVVDRVAHLSRGDRRAPQQAGDPVATRNPRRRPFDRLPPRAAGDLCRLGRLPADHQMLIAVDVADDRIVHLVAADPHGLPDDDSHQERKQATSVVPPPMSTIIVPVASATGRPAPIAAAIGSSISDTGLRARGTAPLETFAQPRQSTEPRLPVAPSYVRAAM
jgi:hypothetical protein